MIWNIVAGFPLVFAPRLARGRNAERIFLDTIIRVFMAGAILALAAIFEEKALVKVYNL
jgi:hypothetical protein